MKNTQFSQDKAEYRIRLFLSVDLVASTAYKYNNDHSEDWFKAFEYFFKKFPEILIGKYKRLISRRDYSRILDTIEKRSFPKIWKPMGDEIIFCCRVYSKHHLITCMNAFTEAIIDYNSRNEHTHDNLDVKGTAWIASFPSPNSSIRTNQFNKRNNNLKLTHEEEEKLADQKPYEFDFLGKEIDGGFRIAMANSTRNLLAISPGLAILLIENNQEINISFSHRNDICLFGERPLKGVIQEQPFPILGILLKYRSDPVDLIERNNLKTDIFRRNRNTLVSFLKKFLETYNIPIPKL